MIEMYLLQILALFGTGLIAGFASGALGVGGAFIMVPVQFWALQSMGIDPTIAVRTSFGTSLLVLFPTAISGALAHHRKGSVLWRSGVILGLTGGSAAFIGAFVASRLPARLLTIVFGCVVTVMAVRMLTAHQPSVPERRSDNYIQVVLWGTLFGFVSGIIGVGGGGLMIPVMTNFLRFSVHEAVGTAAALMIFTALGGSLSYLINGLGVQGLPTYSTGYLNWLQFSLLACSSIPMALVGAKAAHVLPSDRLKMILVFVMLYVGMKMIGILSWLGLPI